MDKSKAIVALLTVNALAVLYVGYSLHGAIRDSDSRNDSTLRELRQQVETLEGRITSGVKQELIARADKVERLHYTWSETDLTQKKAKVALQVALREVSASADIAVSLRRDGQAEPLEAMLKPQGGLQYGTELELSLEHNYELTVWEQSDAGRKQLNAEARRLPLFDDMYRSRVEQPSRGTALSNDQLSAELSFLLKDLGIPGTGLKQALLRIKKDGAVYDEIDVTGQATPDSARNAEMEDHYKVARASGEIDSSVTLEQFARDHHNASGPTDTAAAGGPSPYTRYVLRHAIEFAKDYPELKLTRDTSGQLSFEWVLRFEDGYEYLN